MKSIVQKATNNQKLEIGSEIKQIKGNENTLIITESSEQTNLCVYGNENTIEIFTRKLQLLIKGNGNTVKVRSTNLEIRVVGNSNEIVVAQDFQQNQNLKIGVVERRGYGNTFPQCARFLLTQNKQLENGISMPMGSDRRFISGNLNNPEDPFERTHLQSNQNKTFCQGRYGCRKFALQEFRKQEFNRKIYNEIDNGNGTFLLQRNKESRRFLQPPRNGLCPISQLPTHQRQISNSPLLQQPQLRPLPPAPPLRVAPAVVNLLSKQELSQIPKMKHVGQALYCVICCQNIEEEHEAMYLFCFHNFHANCCQEWFKKSVKCPICQSDIKKQLNKIQNIENATQEVENIGKRVNRKGNYLV